MNDVVDWTIFVGIVLAFLLLIAVAIILGVQNDRMGQEIRIKDRIITAKTKELDEEHNRRLSTEAQLGRELAGRHRKEL